MANAELVEGYRLAREAQDRRFEAAVRGGISCHDTKTPEYQEYFGTGEYAGAGVERRVTFKEWLIASRRPEDAVEMDAGPRGGVATVDDGWRDPNEVEPEPEMSVWDVESVERPSTPAGMAFRMTGAELAELAAAGDAGAEAEIVRRRERRAAKRAGRLAVAA